MKVEALKMDPEAARAAWRKYQEHRAYQAPHDAEIAAIYKRIAQGHTVIRALESIRSAGLNENGLPKLSIARADMPFGYFTGWNNSCELTSGEGQWHARRGRAAKNRNRMFQMEWPGMVSSRGTHEAIVPIIPVHLRPKRGLANYHILWEAEWTKRYPVDPYLLRRFGGDAWLVVAAWDLTDVERAVMSSRLNS